MKIHKGSCHCGAIHFEVEAPDEIYAQECNCSICRLTGFLHLNVPRSRFKVLRGEDNITTYTFNTGAGVAKLVALNHFISRGLIQMDIA